MNIARGFGEARYDQPDAPDGGVDETLALGGDERRMHVRAYNHWVSLLKGRAYPSIEDLDPAGIADFGPHSVLLDFTKGVDDPSFPFLGRALREECGIDQSLTRISQVPARSLLSRLTDHYLQIIANRAPIGFEAEFTGTRGHATLYRGILMPFSSDDDSIDYIYGVINWKEVADATMQSALAAELAAAVRAAPPVLPEPAAVWADGPSASDEPAAVSPDTLADHLALARDSAAALSTADGRSRAALYEVLGRAHDFALATQGDAEGLRELLEDAGITAQARAPMTPIVKLVFGVDHDKTRLTEFAAVLGHAARHAVLPGGLPAFVIGHAGGIKGIVAAERSTRRLAKPAPAAMPTLAERPVLASISFGEPVEPGAVVVLIARGGADGRLEIVGSVNQTRIVEAVTKALG